MKNYAKTGGKKGKPAYRTPASFRYRKYIETAHTKKERNFEKWR